MAIADKCLQCCLNDVTVWRNVETQKKKKKNIQAWRKYVEIKRKKKNKPRAARDSARLNTPTKEKQWNWTRVTLLCHEHGTWGYVTYANNWIYIGDLIFMFS